MESRETSLNSILIEFARKYFSVRSVKSEQRNNTCSKESDSLYGIQKGWSSPFNNRKEWVIYERPIRSRDTTVSVSSRQSKPFGNPISSKYKTNFLTSQAQKICCYFPDEVNFLVIDIPGKPPQNARWVATKVLTNKRRCSMVPGSSLFYGVI